MTSLAHKIKFKLKQLAQKSIPEPATAGEAAPQIEIYEATHMLGRPSEQPRPRLNLVLPTLKKEHVFGGILTALQFFLELAGKDIDARIILSDQHHYPEVDLDSLAGWQIGNADVEDQPGRWIIPFADRGIRTLPVRERDMFVATAWWTAYALQRLLGWQARHFQQSLTPLVYLVQDHEPGFYPWSTRYVLAQSTYQYDGRMIGIFNTRFLYDYFCQQGYDFSSHYIFEPQMNSVLYSQRRQLRQLTKQRTLILYGRPGVPRNGLELVCQAVRHWSGIDPQARDWTIYSIGEKHGDINLHNGCKIVSLGKLTLDQYTDILQQAAIGLSLMFSPHPSYPPLEMAEFGVQTITNTFANKNLSTISPFIHSLDSPTPENIAALICQFAAVYREQPAKTIPLPDSSIFAPPGQAYPFIDELRGRLQISS